MNLRTKWCDEIETYRTIKSAFVLEGDILDLQLWKGENSYYDLTLLDNYLFMYLSDVGYQNIVFYNRVDGFYNKLDKTGQMLHAFEKISGLVSSNGEQKPSIAAAINCVRTAMQNRDRSCAVVMNLSSLLITSPSHMDHSEIEYFATLLLAMRESMRAPSSNGDMYLNNIYFLLVNKANDLPAWFYMNNPYIKVISINKPSRDERQLLIEGHRYSAFEYSSLSDDIVSKIEKNLVGITDGFTAMEVDRILQICEQDHLPYQNYYKIINAYRYGQKDDPWERLRSTDLYSLETKLAHDVKGQPAALSAVSDVIKRAASGLSGLQHSSSGRPKGVLFFAGPTGTGKTELAKSLARVLFGDESNLLRFDMSEYGHEHSDQRLLGAPPGYVGYDEGGELTNAVKMHPFSIILFDEIEKAHPSILDKFLQILDDGRMTDSKGETIYFTETLIIFTSNKGIYKSAMDGQRKPIVTAQNTYEEIESSVKAEIRNYFISELGRPEILNRIGNNFIVFDYIRENAVSQILEKQIDNIFRSVHESRNITILLDKTSGAWETLHRNALLNLEFGGRGIGNIVEKYLLNPLARKITDDKWENGATYNITDIKENSHSVDISVELQ